MRILVPSRRDAGSWPWLAAGAAAAAGVGSVIGSGSARAVPLVAVGLGGLLLVLPLSWLAGLSLATALLFRMVAPTATGILSYAPDATLLLVVARAGATVAVRGSAQVPRSVRWMVVVVAAFVAIAVASYLLNGDSPIALIASLRQFLRFPLWAVALMMAGITWREGRIVLAVLLAISVLQFPVTLYQYVTTGGGAVISGPLYHGDPVSGTFGIGGSGSMMIFLVLAAVVWLSLILDRSIPAWVVWVIGPALVLPMAWASAATFVVLLPVALVTLLIRTSLSRQTRLRPRAVLGGLILAAIAVWAAGAVASAPGFSGSGRLSAREIFSDRYLTRYYLATGDDSGSRLGFLRFAVDTDLHAGVGGALVGQGPSASIIGAASQTGLKPSLSEFSATAERSVWSLQRLLLGFGFVAVVLYVLVIVLGASGPRIPRAPPGTRRGLVIALPILALVFILAGPYNSAWSDPGVSAAFWTLVLLAHVAASDGEPGTGAQEAPA
jgi:hypothetical protein